MALSIPLLPLVLALGAYAIPRINLGAEVNQNDLFPTLTRSDSSAPNDTSTSQSSNPRWSGALKFGVDYYPSQWPESMWEGDAQRMAELGLDYVRISEFDWVLLEPTEGNYNWTLLDRSIEVLGKEGLKVIIGTPTATPPIWAVESYDILAADANRAPRRFGSRRHYSFSSPDFRKLSQGITEAMAKRYAKDPRVAGWQLDNELGQSGLRTWDQKARKAFDQWLEQKYGTVENMNALQGRVFWSMNVQSFDQIDVPSQEDQESNPAVRLDFFQFSSDQVISFAKEQTDIIRKYNPGAFITTNFMGYFFDFDHHKFMNQTGLDLATWDSYPLGNLEQFSWMSDELKVRYGRTGHPDSQALNHAIYRGVAGSASGESSGAWGIMEQQPGGPVNWAPYNPAPAAGMLRLWIHEQLAGSASLIQVFRWREVPYAQEQMHSALYRRDNTPDIGYREFSQVINQDIRALADAGLAEVVNGSIRIEPAPRAQVALVMDYNAAFLLEAEPQGGVWSVSTFTGFPFIYPQLLLNWYSALRRLGLHVDVVGPDAPLDGYKLVAVPSLPMPSAEFSARFGGYSGSAVFGPRSASKVGTLSIPEGLPPSEGPLRDRLPMVVARVESLRPDVPDKVAYKGKTYNVTAWSEWLECSRDGVNASHPGEATYSGYRDGEPATCGHVSGGSATTTTTTRYIGYYADADFLVAYLGDAAAEAGATDILGRTVSAANDLGPDLRLTPFAGSGAVLAVNYGPEALDVPGLPDGAVAVVGGGSSGNSSSVGPAGLGVFKL